MSVAKNKQKITALAQTEIKFPKWFLPTSLFVFLAGVGAEIYSPTVLSFIAYYRIEQKLERCWHSVIQANDIVTIHKSLSGCGLTMHEKKVTSSGVREEYWLPLDILDTHSDEWFYFYVIHSDDSVHAQSVWTFETREDKPIFSESSKQMRRSTRSRQFAFSLVVFLLYVASVAFVCIIGPRIIVAVSMKPKPVDKAMQTATALIMGISCFVALGCVLLMFINSMLSMIILPEQLALLMP